MPDSGENQPLVDALEALDALTDVTFLLVHLAERGMRLDDQIFLVRIVLQDAMTVLREQGTVPEGCVRCGSRHPESSSWHRSHCGDLGRSRTDDMPR